MEQQHESERVETSRSENTEAETRLERRDQTPEPELRIYVASLSDYNDGRLHGTWINADQPVEGITAEIQAMLKRSPMPMAEEYAIHDFEGFGPVRLSEFDSVENVARLAAGIAEHGQAFAHWAAHVGIDDPDALEEFEDHYQGHWQSMEDYAEAMVDDLGVDTELDRLVTGLRPYVRVDIEALARDLAIEQICCEGDGGVYIFWP
jgi:antirestriction protein